MKVELQLPRTPIDRLMGQAEGFMRQAEESGNLDSWIKHYLIWLELYPLKLNQYKRVRRPAIEEIWGSYRFLVI